MSIESDLKQLLTEKKATLSVAESCTGGLISGQIVNVPGISEYFMGGIVAYDNSVKMKVLNVSTETLLKYGAVSEETAKEMVENVKKLMNTNCAISTTGIAGPTGGTEEKPVGLVYIGVSVKERIEIQRFIFKDKHSDPIKKRNKIRKKAAKKAIKLLISLLKEEKNV